MTRAERIAARAERRARREERARQLGTLVSAPPKIEPTDAVSFVRADGKPLHLNGIYQGASVFLTLSGPSINELDLSKLHRRGVVTFGCNNSTAIFRPNIWLAVDPCEKFHSALWLDPFTLKLISSRKFGDRMRVKLPNGTFDRMKDSSGREILVREMPNVAGYVRNSFYNPSTWLSEPTINWGNSKKSANRNHQPRILNSMLALIKCSYVLGFRTVYLLGCDFSMSSEKPYAFEQEGDREKAISNNNGFRTMNQLFHELRPQFEAAGFNVLNCNPLSGLTAFDHISYDEAIERATSHIQQKLDTVGWYDKKIG